MAGRAVRPSHEGLSVIGSCRMAEPFWLWDKEKACQELDMMGYIRAGDEIEQHDGFILIRGSKGRR